MHRSPAAALTAAALGTVLSLTACGAGPTSGSAGSAATPAASMSKGTASPAGGETMAAGAYLALDDYRAQMASRAGTKVVYFFHASWCPDCRATERSINADGVPAGLTIVKLDYDTETDLRKRYGVTQQHTFVQVDPDGAELGKWTGSRSGADIKAKTV